MRASRGIRSRTLLGDRLVPRPLLINQLPVFLRKWEHRIRTTTPSAKKKKKSTLPASEPTWPAVHPPRRARARCAAPDSQPAGAPSSQAFASVARPRPTRSHSCTSVTASRCFALQHQSCPCPQRPPLPASGHATGRPPPFTHRDASRPAPQSLRRATPGDGSSSSSDLRSQQLWPAESPGLSLLGSGGMGSCGPRSSCHTPCPLNHPPRPWPELRGALHSKPAPLLFSTWTPAPAQHKVVGAARPAPGAPLPRPQGPRCPGRPSAGPGQGPHPAPGSSMSAQRFTIPHETSLLNPFRV